MEKKNSHAGHRERMKNKFLKNGIEVFEPHEALEILLFYSNAQKNTNPIAHDLLDTFGGDFYKVFDAEYEELLKVKGIGAQSAFLIKLVAALGNYYNRSKWSEKPKLMTSAEVGSFTIDYIGERRDEIFIIICLDSSRKVIAVEKVAEGSVNKVNVDVRKTVEKAIKNNATSVILAHNHPAGIAKPSMEDIEVTRVLREAFETINITVTDHIIVSDGIFVSMAGQGYI